MDVYFLFLRNIKNKEHLYNFYETIILRSKQGPGRVIKQTIFFAGHSSTPQSGSSSTGTATLFVSARSSMDAAVTFSLSFADGTDAYCIAYLHARMVEWIMPSFVLLVLYGHAPFTSI